MSSINSAFSLSVIGLAVASSLGVASEAQAGASPFQMIGVQKPAVHFAREGVCGGDSDSSTEGSCGEGSCGGDSDSSTEGSCGEGSCGGDVGASTEGSCGEGSCGGDNSVGTRQANYDRNFQNMSGGMAAYIAGSEVHTSRLSTFGGPIVYASGGCDMEITATAKDYFGRDQTFTYKIDLSRSTISETYKSVSIDGGINLLVRDADGYQPPRTWSGIRLSGFRNPNHVNYVYRALARAASDC